MSVSLHRPTAFIPHDPLTLLAETPSFTAYLDSRLRGLQGVALLLIDVDNLGEINTTYGRDYGDEILCEMARRLRVMSGPRNTPARIGGDRFAVVVGAEHRDEAETASLSVLRLLNAPVNVKGGQLTATVSIGVVRATIASSAQTMLADAIEPLTAAKAAGGNVWRVAMPRPAFAH